MSLWRQLTYGLRSLTNRAKQDRETAEEVEQYFEEAEAAWRSRGLSAQDARRAARLEGGSMAAAKERVNEYGWENIARSFFGDLRCAARQLWKHPVFTATATLTLALGIGANAAIFTVIESVLLAPLPYKHADKLAVLNTHWTNSGHTTARITGPDGVDVRDQSRSIEAMSLYSGGNLGVQLRDHSVYTGVTFVDANFARVFSLQPIAGRTFTDADAHHAALVSEQFARDHFGGTQAALGQMLQVESEPVEIVGVLPGGFDFPAGTQVWEAFPLRPASEERTAFNYKAVARLRSGYNLPGCADRTDGNFPPA